MPEPPSGDDRHHAVWEHRQAELWDRIFQVTQDVVTLAEALSNEGGGAHVKQQMLQSSMSVGRHVVRATAADAAGQFSDSLQEAKLAAVETDYWLRLAYMLQQREEVQQDLSSVINQYSAIVDLLERMISHVRREKDAISRHTRGRRVS